MPNPASPVVPGLESHEVTYAKEQPEYLPLPSLRSPAGKVMTRWEFTPEERELIADGADLYLTLWTFNQPLQPVQLEVHAKNPNPAYFAHQLELGGDGQ